MSDSMHLAHAELAAYLDGELTRREAAPLREHLAVCGECASELSRLSAVSATLREFVAFQAAHAGVASRTQSDRERLLVRLSPPVTARPNISGADSEARKVFRRFGWAMALAASIAVAVLFVPHHGGSARRADSSGFAPAPKVQVASVSVNGETFVTLPYSDPDLPMNAPRIVEMQVPVASLTAAGISLDPVMNGSPDGMVRANVLLGMDGQPLGLHVLTAE